MQDQERIVVTHTENGNRYTHEPSGKVISDRKLNQLVVNNMVDPVYGGLFGDDIQEYVFTKGL
ncbi:hypothetical protein [Brucella phage EF4]|nr:hypothetical protein [Brucella phage EF4]